MDGAAYDAVLARWPVPYETLDLASEFGTTRVYASGPADTPPLVLLHGGGGTATVWYSTVAELSRHSRVYAVDQLGSTGRSIHSGRALRHRSDLMAWLDATVTALGHDEVDLMGHSYGGWLAVSYALHAPQRVRRLVLLDPSECFVPMGLAYKLRGIPLLLWPSAGRLRKLLRWETRGAQLDPPALAVMVESAARRFGVVMPRRPSERELANLKTPTLVLVAERTRSHDPVRLAERARRLLPDGTVVVLPGASHHTVPTGHVEAITRATIGYLGGRAVSPE